MSDIEQTIKSIRPRLKDVAPQTFWFSIGFAIFNLVVGIALFNTTILTSLQLVGVIPLKIWALMFMAHGVYMLIALAMNDWKITRFIHLAGLLIKSAWWMELLAATVAGRSPFLLFIWSLLLFLQAVVWIYFTPRLEHGE